MMLSLFPTPLLVSEFDVKPELLQWVKKHHEHSMSMKVTHPQQDGNFGV